jgi:hypothetical protein
MHHGRADMNPAPTGNSCGKAWCAPSAVVNTTTAAEKGTKALAVDPEACVEWGGYPETEKPPPKRGLILAGI